jgi:hypothetical protein
MISSTPDKRHDFYMVALGELTTGKLSSRNNFTIDLDGHVRQIHLQLFKQFQDGPSLAQVAMLAVDTNLHRTNDSQ